MISTRETILQIVESTTFLRDEAIKTRDHVVDASQACYWSGRANALTELIERIRNWGV